MGVVPIGLGQTKTQVGIVYSLERLATAIHDIGQLAPAQYAEMAQGFGNIPLSVDWKIYVRAEELGAGFLLTARDGGNLIGYFGMLVHPHLSAKGELAATSTPYYVVKCSQRGLILRRLIAGAVNEAKARGVTLICVRTHVWASAGPLLEHVGFRPIETSYMLRVTEATNGP